MDLNNESISSYLSLTLEESNNLENTVNSSLTITNNEQTQIDTLYLNYISNLNNYRNYTISDINNLTSTEKETLLLLLHKTNLAYETIAKINVSSEKHIENYKLTTEQYNINSYAIYEMIITNLDNYETYTYQNKITNYSETIYNNDLLILAKKRKKQEYPAIRPILIQFLNLIPILDAYQYCNI